MPHQLKHCGEGLPVGRRAGAAVEQIWHIQDSQGLVLDLAFRLKLLERVKLFPSSLGNGVPNA